MISLQKKISINLIVEKEGDYNYNKIDYVKNGNILFQWKDKIISLEQNKFVRYIGKSTIHYENGKVILYKIEKKTSGITKKVLPKNNQPINKIITMDLETILINNIHIPYLLCWYDGNKNHNYFIKNLIPSKLEDNILLMISLAMKDINKKKYKGYRIYLHNFAKFDGYFLLNYLSKIGDCNPIIHKGRIISNRFSLNENNYEVIFKDSFLVLPSNLRDLCKSFAVDTIKSIFPFQLNNINYQGVVPDFKNFNNIPAVEYENYKKQYINKIWNFKEEANKYCIIDCIALYQILVKFNQLIWDKFKINIGKFPTIPSLTFNLFISKYLKKDTIHMISGEIADRIRLSYSGGAVDMYLTKLINPKTKKIYAYDVNALYPYVMSVNEFPIGNPTYFKGNILNFDPNAFGFFYCKITVPSYIQHPILQT